MKTVVAKRQFSHYHEGNFDEGQVRSVPDDVAEALEGMDLVEVRKAPSADVAKKTAPKAVKK